MFLIFFSFSWIQFFCCYFIEWTDLLEATFLLFILLSEKKNLHNNGYGRSRWNWKEPVNSRFCGCVSGSFHVFELAQAQTRKWKSGVFFFVSRSSLLSININKAVWSSNVPANRDRIRNGKYRREKTSDFMKEEKYSRKVTFINGFHCMRIWNGRRCLEKLILITHDFSGSVKLSNSSTIKLQFDAVLIMSHDGFFRFRFYFFFFSLL